MYEELPIMGTITGFDFSKGSKGVVLMSNLDIADLLYELSNHMKGQKHAIN